ncbi:MAG: Mannosylfructose-phosphate synthase [candidate division WS2 bacterium]|nr:Mannosylfructose-phosphate synthase [Candidatus Lithacetigena glycinireducens]MBT9174846.1 Mannosylfructose-phosphate synthase [Candidatus Lithacetigena glycinireducens]
MIIGIDARFAVHNRRGIGNYTLKLIQNLAEIDIKNEYILYIDIDDSNNVLPKKDNFKTKKIFPSNYFLWEQISLPIQAKRDAVEILHCTGNTAPILLDRRIKKVVTIHDVMYLKDYSTIPQSLSMYQRWGRTYRKMIVPRAIKHIAKVVTVSNFSKNDIKEHLPALKEDAILVTHEAADERFSKIGGDIQRSKVSDKFDIKGNYILTLGALDPRKNTKMVINTFLHLKSEKKINVNLVIAGIPNWRQTEFYKTVQESSFREDIIFTDFISEEDMVLLYNCATVFLYPSLYEGFGIPPLEAMACGTPVITSNTTSIPEIVGNAAFLIDPLNDKDLKDALLSLLNNEDLRNDFIERGFKRAKEFSWNKMAKETLQIYESLRHEN